MTEVLLESCRVDPGDGFQYLSLYQHVSRYKKARPMKKISKLFFPSVSNFVNSYFKWLPEELFLSKKLLFRFYRKILFNLKILTDGISEWRRQLKDDLGTRP